MEAAPLLPVMNANVKNSGREPTHVTASAVRSAPWAATQACSSLGTGLVGTERYEGRRAKSTRSQARMWKRK